jgi:hypothetical protein
MNELKSKRRSFSSPDQLNRIQLVIINRWTEVLLAAETRNKPGHESLPAEPNLMSDKFLPPLLAAS